MEVERAQTQLVIPVQETSQVGQARRSAVALANSLGLDETDSGRVALIATEAATNMIKHAKHGELLLRPLRCGDQAGLEVLAIDRGPGLADVQRCFTDGFSTAGSPGTGLGAVKRLAQVCDIYSVRGKGTALVAEVWHGERPVQAFDVGAICVPIRGETVAGDAWHVVADGARVIAMVADGLGHGPLAAEASVRATALLGEYAGESPAALLDRAHAALRSTRGATVAVAEIEGDQREVRYAGIGNIGAAIVTAGGDGKSLVSMNGTVGGEARRVQQFSYPLPPRSLIVMYSDGLTSRWQLQDYPGLAQRHPALIAGTLYRDFGRQRDDAAVLVIREAL